jgi:hypothetical protein
MPGLDGYIEGEPGYVLADELSGRPCSSKYGELTSMRDSDADVAMEVRGACRLCGRGTCCPVL